LKIYLLNLLLIHNLLFSFQQEPVKKNTSNNDIDVKDLFVKLKLVNIGNFDLSALLISDSLYLPVSELFNILKIKAAYDNSKGIIKGSLLKDKSDYLINAEKHVILLGDKIFNLEKKDLYRSKSEVFLSLKILNRLFELNIKFFYKDLLLLISEYINIPIFQERKRINEMAKNQEFLQRKKYTKKSIFPRERKLFDGAMVNWSLSYYRNSQNLENLNYSVSLGGEVFYGDYDISFGNIYNNKNALRVIPFRWRYVEENGKYLKQINIGDVYVAGLQPLLFQGIQLSNRPALNRKIFENRIIKNKSFPNSDIEVYKNNQLFQYSKTDSMGYYNLNIPIQYGDNFIKIRSVNEYAEEYLEEKFFRIPYNFIPKGELEYSLSLGNLKYYDYQDAADIDVKFGLTSFSNIGGGMQYIKEKNKKYFYPGIYSHVIIGENLLAGSEIAYNNRIKLMLKFMTSDQIGAEINLIRFNKNYIFNASGNLEEKNITLQIPLRKKNVSFGMDLNVRESLYVGDNKYLNLFGRLYCFTNGLFGGVDFNSSWSNFGQKYISQYLSSSITTSFSLYSNSFQSQLNINHKTNKISSIRLNINRIISNKCWTAFSIFRDFQFGNYGFNINIHFDLSLFQVDSRIETVQNFSSFQQSMRGTLGYNNNENNILFSNNSWVRSGAVIVKTFYDKNNNNIFDLGDTACAEKINYYMDVGNKYDQSTVVNLEPYDTCLITLDPERFLNPLLKIKDTNLVFVAEPNKFKIIQVPVYPTGEICGNIRGIPERNLKGIKIIIKNSNNGDSVVTKTFTRGEYYKEGLQMDKYTCFIEPQYLKNNNLISIPEYHEFSIKFQKEGQLIEEINFLLKSK
jgi:hypothetical protein